MSRFLSSVDIIYGPDANKVKKVREAVAAGAEVQDWVKRLHIEIQNALEVQLLRFNIDWEDPNFKDHVRQVVYAEDPEIFADFFYDERLLLRVLDQWDKDHFQRTFVIQVPSYSEAPNLAIYDHAESSD
jgi:hypothetical protein